MCVFYVDVCNEATYVQTHGHRRAVWILFAAQSWALWHIRNKIAIEIVFPNQPADGVLKTLLFL
jgi:hypothetical protein